MRESGTAVRIAAAGTTERGAGASHAPGVLRPSSQSRARSRVASRSASGMGRIDHSQLTPQKSIGTHHAASRALKRTLNSPARTLL